MILVDTSVLIDFLKGKENHKVKMFELILKKHMPYGIASYTYQEVLQGAKNDLDYAKLKQYLAEQTIYYLPETLSTYEEAAQMVFDLRRQGITPRGTIDILIALIAIKNNLFLLHNDHDFDLMAQKISALQIMETV